MVRRKLFALMVMGVAVAGVSGCATKGEVDQLKSEVAALRQDVNQMKSQMQGIRDAVDRSAAMSTERQERMYDRGLRK
jgi:outer membrane murein-binding lipoprotein Lpp